MYNASLVTKGVFIFPILTPVNVTCNGGTNGSNNLALTGTSQNGVAGGGGDIYIPWGATYNVNFNRATGEWIFSDGLSTNIVSNNKFSVYPNPSNNLVNIQFKNETDGMIYIKNIAGQVVKTVKVNGLNNNISTQELSAGTYLITWMSKGKTSTSKLVIQH